MDEHLSEFNLQIQPMSTGELFTEVKSYICTNWAINVMQNFC